MLLQLSCCHKGCLAQLAALDWLRCECCCCHDCCICLLGGLEWLCSLLARLVVIIGSILWAVGTAQALMGRGVRMQGMANSDRLVTC
jgi:hypothetical protein